MGWQKDRVEFPRAAAMAGRAQGSGALGSPQLGQTGANPKPQTPVPRNGAVGSLTSHPLPAAGFLWSSGGD